MDKYAALDMGDLRAILERRIAQLSYVFVGPMYSPAEQMEHLDDIADIVRAMRVQVESEAAVDVAA